APVSLLSRFPASMPDCDGVIASYKRNAAALGTPHAALALAHLHAQNICQRCHAAGDLLFIQTRVAETQRIRQGVLHIEVAAWSDENSAFFRVNQEFAVGKA